MTITADTPISSLMNANEVASLCETFTTKVNSFKQSASSIIRGEMLAGLSSENCLVKGQALLEDAGSKTITFINGIDTGVTSKIVEKAKSKRLEELIRLRLALTLKISTLGATKRNLQSKSEPDPNDAARIADLQKDIDKYQKKLEEVDAEIGRL